MSSEHHSCNGSRDDAFQDHYRDDYAHCFGCGRLNERGLQIKSYWQGEEAVCRFLPAEYYTGGKKDILYGGLIASLIDCHGAATAAAAKAKALKLDMDQDRMPRFVTASLKVDYLAPTPMNREIELRATVSDISGRKVIVEVNLLADKTVCARGEALFIQLQD